MKKGRIILHSDMNCFYANVECQEHPELRNVPVVVGGNEENRHGIVLAKNQLAKNFGVQTGEALWQARKKCPGLVVVPPNYQLYMRVSKMARRIYYDYTDLVEPFGPDEAWLDISGSWRLWANEPSTAALLIAQEISERMKAELGLTVSIGISWNKIFAKFGSDYRKPDALTFITPENYQRLVWESPVRDLLYVGSATERKLHSSAIETIGDLAHSSDELLQRRLGKMGLVLKGFALGADATPVRPYDWTRNDVDRAIKSYGNGLTSPFDIVCEQDAKCLIWLLCESVAQRLREGRACARTISVGIRSAEDLSFFGRQMPLPQASNITTELMSAAWSLARSSHRFCTELPVRGLHVRASNLQPVASSEQLALFDPQPWRTRNAQLDTAIDDLRRRFGNTCIVRGIELSNKRLKGIDIKGDNVVHPESFFH